MLKINVQFFAHKKGSGSTKNGRDSESKRLGLTILKCYLFYYQFNSLFVCGTISICP